ncbi:DAK2 domain-containing protein [Nocardioides terrisoli]|uniref:DAK2 domain-containing protein n=1 Tax=Nocardioides terrisoli TaxID=3388267 RepID=UPI00287B63A5|nr:DAK2 domain-containing protein [Nocardioides marmorisolisilvae]
MEQHATFDRAAVLRFADLVTAGLSEAREEIDALNVYPVPDGDTGTNLYLTVEAARDAVRECVPAEHKGDLLAATLSAYARGALLGARGNSGVILSQLVGALFRRMSAAGPDDRSAAVFADGMRAAADAAYAAVGKPVEGTMLTVARAAADAAGRASTDPAARLADVVVAAAAAAHEALARTPDQMPLLKQAGVVDAGGRGLCVVLDAAETALTGRRAMTPSLAIGTHVIPTPGPPVPTGDLTEDGPAYEVMYLLDAPDEAIPALRERLGGLGDSLVVVGGEGLWNVHVHTDDVGAAVEAGIGSGTPRRIRVTHFAEQVSRARERRAAERRTGRGVVAVVAGDGLAEVFAEAGAAVLRGGPGRRPSTGEILAAIEHSGAAEVIVLPNDPDSVGVAEAAAHAAEESGQVHVVVIPTRAQVQGLAALAVHEPGRPLDADVVQMTSAARGTRHGAITIAARQAMTMAGACEPGDVLGVLQGDFAVIGDDRFAVAVDVLGRLLVGGGELVTVVGGEDCGDLVERCEEWVHREHPGVDVLTYAGGQERYPLLLAVE